MKPDGDRFERVESIYHAALGRPPSQRAAFLDEACGADAALRSEVASLLAYEDRSGQLDRPALENQAWREAKRFETGASLGHYTILEKLGTGGMGVVYRARDTRLGRDVALKVLPPALLADRDRRDRFEREAQSASRLNHPNIVTIYDIGEAEGTSFIAMEYVPGKTLEDTIPRGGMRLADALGCAIQMAGALERAHAAGIVHRDLKPANVMIAPEAAVKILDFGLAKLTERAPAPDAATVTAHTETQTGLVMGTPAFMSPEQAEGKPLDARSDIFSFGAVLYQMVTGRRPFAGESLMATMAAVLRQDPEPLPEHLPRELRQVIEKCLRKDLRRRAQSMADIRVALEDVREQPPVQQPDTRLARSWRWVAGAAILCGVAAVGGFLAGYRGAPAPPAPVTRFDLSVSPLALRGFSVSPDGRMLAYTEPVSGKSMIWVRVLGSEGPAESRAGTEEALFPFWSPDSKSIAFFAGDKLKRMEAAGGPVQTICDGVNGQPRGMAWGSAGVIVISLGGGLLRVDVAGGKPQPLTEKDTKREISHGWPYFLPDGRRFIYFSEGAPGVAVHTVYASSLDHPRERVKIAEIPSSVVYGQAPGGKPAFLLYSRQGNLVAHRFDPDRLRLEGEAKVIAGQVGHAIAVELEAAASENGVLAYSSQPARLTRMTWVTREGKTIEQTGPPDAYLWPELSPDGKRLLMNNDQKGLSAWVYEFARGTLTPLTFTVTGRPHWSADGSAIIFSQRGEEEGNLFRKRADGSTEQEQLTRSPNPQVVWSTSPDGKFLLFGEPSPAMKGDLWVLPLDGDRKPSLFLQTRFNETQAQFSPDSQWVAYASDESGRLEIHIRKFSAPGSPAATGHWTVSNAGGQYPRWRADGKEIYYWSNNKVMAADIRTTGNGIETGIPHELFPLDSPFYCPARDGRFVVLKPVESATITVVTNWTELVRQ